MKADSSGVIKREGSIKSRREATAFFYLSCLSRDWLYSFLKLNPRFSPRGETILCKCGRVRETTDNDTRSRNRSFRMQEEVVYMYF